MTETLPPSGALAPDGAGRPRVAVVTGAASGIGRACALRLAAENIPSVLVDRSAEGLRSLALLTGQETVRLVSGDVSDADVTREAVRVASEEFGGLTDLFNIAGITGPSGSVEELSGEDFDRVMAVNVRGAFLGIRAAVPVMRRTGSGCIVNMASAIGLVGGRGQAGYTASKHAVVGLTKAAALDLAPYRIRVNCVCPGVVDTPMTQGSVADPALRERFEQAHPLGRFAGPDEVAAAVLWLAGADAAFVTGTALTVDGGYTAG
ncbi:SDR family NAD(P)-dependent oxidoreductase [Streptosporangium sp. NPDC049644]|uniref:SDR family NAD(P)-dependent oxidoreductase n=1 Tax=Streptosporangium sp. NPDC049644 TaxID=3155507 RepID=UPI00343A6F7F